MSVVMEQIQFSLIRIKIGSPERLLTPLHLPTTDNISFLPYYARTLNVDVVYHA